MDILQGYIHLRYKSAINVSLNNNYIKGIPP